MMNHGGDAAEQLVNFGIKGAEMLLRISGSGAKNLAAFLAALMKDQKKTRGKTRLQTMLKSGKELKVFRLKNQDLRYFAAEARRYGILFVAVKDKQNEDGLCDLLVRAEDASKVNRVLERIQYANVDVGTIKAEIQKDKDKTANPTKARMRNGSERQNSNPSATSSKPKEDITEVARKPSIRKQIHELRQNTVSRNRRTNIKKRMPKRKGRVRS